MITPAATISFFFFDQGFFLGASLDAVSLGLSVAFNSFMACICFLFNMVSGFLDRAFFTGMGGRFLVTVPFLLGRGLAPSGGFRLDGFQRIGRSIGNAYGGRLVLGYCFLAAPLKMGGRTGAAGRTSAGRFGIAITLDRDEGRTFIKVIGACPALTGRLPFKGSTCFLGK